MGRRAIQLTAEEAYLWELARTWRDPRPPADPAVLDWERLVALASANKMPVLLDQVLQQLDLCDQLPPAAREQLAGGVARFQEKAATFTRILNTFGPLAAQRGIAFMPLKGLWVSQNIYGNPAMRPGHDMDVLVRREQVAACVALFETLGFDRYWPGLLPDDYYLRHHLHIELSLTDCWTWVEVHWAFDHPRTLLTIDYAAVMDRATPGTLLGTAVRDPALPDLLLSLSIHLVKHAIFLPYALDRPDLRRILLADGRLMYCMDVAEVVRLHADTIDWQQLVALARETGAGAILGAVLRVCRDELDAPVPTAVIEALPVQGQGGATTRMLMNKMADVLQADYAGEPVSPFWRALASPNWTFVFRPIRLLDLWHYLFPGQDFLQRRYGRGDVVGAHVWRTLGEYARFGRDTLAGMWQVRRRPLAPDVELPPDSKCREA